MKKKTLAQLADEAFVRYKASHPDVLRFFGPHSQSEIRRIKQIFISGYVYGRLEGDKAGYARGLADGTAKHVPVGL